MTPGKHRSVDSGYQQFFFLCSSVRCFTYHVHCANLIIKGIESKLMFSRQVVEPINIAVFWNVTPFSLGER